jgi:hypothetical protein
MSSAKKVNPVKVKYKGWLFRVVDASNTVMSLGEVVIKREWEDYPDQVERWRKKNNHHPSVSGVMLIERAQPHEMGIFRASRFREVTDKEIGVS